MGQIGKRMLEGCSCRHCKKARDEIARLKAENERLRKLLTPSPVPREPFVIRDALDEKDQ